MSGFYLLLFALIFYIYLLDIDITLPIFATFVLRNVLIRIRYFNVELCILSNALSTVPIFF